MASSRSVLAVVFAALLLGGFSAAGAVSARGDDGPPNPTDSTATATTSTEETTTVVTPSPEDLAAQARQIAARKKDLAWQRTQTRYWQYISFVPPTPTRKRELQSSSVDYLRWRVRVWSARREKAKHYAQNPPHYSQFMCIHRYEGSWQDKWDTYWGGVQMDRAFQATYGARFVYKYGGHIEWGVVNGKRVKVAVGGEADKWTPLEQIWTAEQAYKSRGFYPWPTTARACGLIS